MEKKEEGGREKSNNEDVRETTGNVDNERKKLVSHETLQWVRHKCILWFFNNRKGNNLIPSLRGGACKNITVTANPSHNPKTCRLGLG